MRPTNNDKEFGTVLAIVSIILFVSLLINLSLIVMLSESRRVINCASFSTHNQVVNFISTHPEYQARLGGNDGKPCQKLK